MKVKDISIFLGELREIEKMIALSCLEIHCDNCAFRTPIGQSCGHIQIREILMQCQGSKYYKTIIQTAGGKEDTS